MLAASRHHVARLRTHKDRKFTCVRASVEGCAAVPELLLVSHSTEKLSDDLPELNTMMVALPQLDAGQSDVDTGILHRCVRQVEQQRSQHSTPIPGTFILESRRPKWNPRTETFELPFGGRANWASARNFQLVDRDGVPDRAVLLYGKMDEDEFALDFSYPLSVLHALSIVLTTWGW